MKTFVFLLMALSASAAIAKPIHYSEAASGDLTNDYTVFAFDKGENTISGVWGLNFDFDSFEFIVPTGTFVKDIKLTTSGSTSTWFTSFRIGDDFQDIWSAGALAVAPPDGKQMFDALLPLRAGTYEMDHAYLSNLPTTTTNYRWSFLVTPVTPVAEPATWIMLLTGLLALSVVRRTYLFKRAAHA